MKGVNMHATATEVKNNFGFYLEASQKEDVIITKNGRCTAVLINILEGQDVVALNYRAKKKSKSGFMKGEISIPENFDTYHQDEILKMFEGSK
jgi:prevent-host-death family protein